MNQAGDKETTSGSFWASTIESEDSEETDSSEDVPAKPLLIPRSDSQESSSVSFRSECSDSEHTDSAVNRKRKKIFLVQLITPENKYAISVSASDTKTFIKEVKNKATSKCQGKDIEFLLLEIDKDNHIPFEEDNLEFSFLKASKIITVKVQFECSPIRHKAKPLEHKMTMATGVKRNSGKW